MGIVVNKHWRVYLDFWRAGIILNPTRITAYVVNSHALPTVPVYKKNRIAFLLCIFQTAIQNMIKINALSNLELPLSEGVHL